MTNSQPKTKFLSQNDVIFFVKTVQSYFFFKQKTGDSVSEDMLELLQKGQDIVYSLVQDYLKKERFELAYLQDINEILKDLYVLLQKDTYSKDLSILPNQIGEIELQELVPLQFNDAESGLTLNLLFNRAASVLMWNQE